MRMIGQPLSLKAQHQEIGIESLADKGEIGNMHSLLRNKQSRIATEWHGEIIYWLR